MVPAVSGGDVNLAVGNLNALVKAESAAYLRRQVVRLL
jgi:hypothetical protein